MSLTGCYKLKMFYHKEPEIINILAYQIKSMNPRNNLMTKYNDMISRVGKPLIEISQIYEEMIKEEEQKAVIELISASDDEDDSELISKLNLLIFSLEEEEEFFELEEIIPEKDSELSNCFIS